MRRKLKRGNEGVLDYISDRAHILVVTDWLVTERRVSLFCRGFHFFKYHIILELQANFTVRRHILLFYFIFLLLTGVMRKEKGGKRGKKKMDERQEEREKESGEVEERIEERTEEDTEEDTEEGTQETEERMELTEEACEEEERCEEDLESHLAAKRARVCSTFTDSQETVKEHPELYDNEHACFHDRQKKDALWAEISAELKLQPFDVRRWFESQRTHYGKLSKLQSGQAPRDVTKRQFWVYQQMVFLKTHIRRKGASRSSGFEASPNTSKQDESRGSTTDTEHLESSVLRESRSQPMFTSTPVSTDSKILDHFDQMRTLISEFLQQKSDRQPFFDYVASEAEKMTQEEFEDLKGRIFRDIESIKSNRRRQPLARRLPRSPRGSAYCQQPLNRRLLPCKQQLAAVTSTTHQAPLALATLHQL